MAPITGYVSGCLGSVQPTVYDPATTAWINAVVANGGTVSTTRRSLVDALISGLKTDGVWTKLDRLWVLAAENTPSALTDMVADSLATAVNSPTFTTDRGYTGNGTSSYVDTNFNCATATSPHFQQNSACAFVWNNTTAQGNDSLGLVGTTGGQINVRFTDDNCYYNINSGTDKSVANPSGTTGLYTYYRTSSTNIQLDINGSSFDSSTSTGSVAPPNADYAFLHSNLGFSSKQVCAGGCGGALSATDSTNLYNRLRTYMTAVGVP